MLAHAPPPSARDRGDVLNLLADLKSRGLSILFITHDLSLAYYISERAVILYRGRVVELGATGRIFDNPLHPYTQMLMVSVPRLDAKWHTLDQAPQAMLSGHNSGCVYYERCPIAGKECARDAPR
jgi:peptide/nickel transport system ATP-binding protein